MAMQGIATRQALPEMIQASWQRCREYGMSSQWHVTQSPLGASDLHTEQERNQQMRKLALREMRLLERTLAENGRILLLAGPNGLILDSQGDQGFLGRAKKVALTPGASWREQITGTNAIGTAIVERRFVQVLGPQHFFDENRFLACTAMPITAPDGRLAGVLDISGTVQEGFSTAGKLVRHAAAHIEHDWTMESATDLVVRLHQHPAWLGTPEEGVMTFEDDVLTGASARALHCMNLTPLAIGKARWEDLFEGRPKVGQCELETVQTAGIRYAEVARASGAAAKIAATEQAHVGPMNFEDMKDEALRAAVLAEGGNISAAAKKLGIHRSTIYRRLNRGE